MELTIDVDATDRGQVGIGTLIVFIAMVLVAAIAAGVLINTAGFLQTQAEDTGTESTEQVANNLNIITEVGEVNDTGSGEGTISDLRVGVQPAAGSDDLNLEELSVQYVADESFSNLVHINQIDTEEDGTVIGEDTVFNTEPVTAEDGGDNVMTDNADRYDLVVPLGDDKPFVETAEVDTDGNGAELYAVDVVYDDSNTGLSDIAGIFDDYDEDDFVEVNATGDDYTNADLFEQNTSTATTSETDLVNSTSGFDGTDDLDGTADGNLVRVVVYNDEVDATQLDGFDENLGELDATGGALVDQGALQQPFFDGLGNDNLEELVQGEVTELTFTTETGAQTISILQVPDSLAGQDDGDAVDL